MNSLKLATLLLLALLMLPPPARAGKCHFPEDGPDHRWDAGDPDLPSGPGDPWPIVFAEARVGVIIIAR